MDQRLPGLLGPGEKGYTARWNKSLREVINNNPPQPQYVRGEEGNLLPPQHP